MTGRKYHGAKKMPRGENTAGIKYDREKMHNNKMNYSKLVENF